VYCIEVLNERAKQTFILLNETEHENTERSREFKKKKKKPKIKLDYAQRRLGFFCFVSFSGWSG
jgi:hypothetical protein